MNSQWAYVLKGNMNIATVNSEGQNFYDTIVRYLKASIIHRY